MVAPEACGTPLPAVLAYLWLPVVAGDLKLINVAICIFPGSLRVSVRFTIRYFFGSRPDRQIVATVADRIGSALGLCLWLPRFSRN